MCVTYISKSKEKIKSIRLIDFSFIGIARMPNIDHF